MDVLAQLRDDQALELIARKWEFDREAERIKKQLAGLGYTKEKLRELARQIIREST